MSNESNPQSGYSRKAGFFRSGGQWVEDNAYLPADFINSLHAPPVIANQLSGTNMVTIITMIPPSLSEEARLNAALKERENEAKEKEDENQDLRGRLEKTEWKLKQRDKELEEDGIDLVKNFKTIDFLMDDSKRQVGRASSSSAE